MKNKLSLNEYKKLPYKMEIVPDDVENGFIVTFPDLPGCLTCAETLKEVLVLAEDAKSIWLEDAYNNDQQIPLPSQMTKYSGHLRLRMPCSLHKTIAENSQRENISMNQYCIYLLAKGVASDADNL